MIKAIILAAAAVVLSCGQGYAQEQQRDSRPPAVGRPISDGLPQATASEVLATGHEDQAQTDGNHDERGRLDNPSLDGGGWRVVDRIVNFGFLIVAGLAFVVAYWQARLTAKALEATRRSVEAQFSALRAWVTFDFDVLPIAEGMMHDGRFHVRIREKASNIGKTPAFGVLMSSGSGRDSDKLLSELRARVELGWPQNGEPGVTLFPEEVYITPGTRLLDTGLPARPTEDFDIMMGGCAHYFIDADRRDQRATPFVYLISFSRIADDGEFASIAITPHFSQISAT